MKSVGLAAAAICASIALTACGTSNDSLSNQANNPGGANGGSPVEQLPAVKRGKPIILPGTLLTGQPWSITSAKGKVVILNVWGSWCPPCQTEFPHLQAAWKKLQSSGKPVVLMGMDYKEGAATAFATVRERGLTYPTLQYDEQSLVPLAGSFQGAPPTTLVLDSQHRIAARVVGPIDENTLVGLVDDTLSSK